MALLGHVSAEMSLRYGRLFDTTVRAEYERALDLAKHTGPHTGTRPAAPCRHRHHRRRRLERRPALKSRLAGGYCLRAPAQGACPYANICEHCPSFRTERQLAAGARRPARRHRSPRRRRPDPRLDRRSRPPPPTLARLDALIAQARAG